MLTKEIILKERLIATGDRNIKKNVGDRWAQFNTEISTKAIYEAMDEYATEICKSNSQALINYICGVTNTPELNDQPLTLGEIKDVIELYAKEVAIDFEVWKREKQKSGKVHELWVDTPEQLFELYLKSKK